MMPRERKKAPSPKLEHHSIKGTRLLIRLFFRGSQCVASPLRRSNRVRRHKIPQKESHREVQLTMTTTILSGWNRAEINIMSRERSLKRAICPFVRLARGRAGRWHHDHVQESSPARHCTLRPGVGLGWWGAHATTSFRSLWAPIAQECTVLTRARILFLILKQKKKVNTNRKRKAVKVESVGRVKTPQCLSLTSSPRWSSSTGWGAQDSWWSGPLASPARVLPFHLPFLLRELWLVTFLHKPDHLTPSFPQAGSCCPSQHAQQDFPDFCHH